MIKTVKLLVLKTTLAKDNKGRKTRVKEGETFTTDPNTAEMYLKTYKNVFQLVDDKFVATNEGGVNDNSERLLELENENEKLIKENTEFESENERLLKENTELKLEILR